jgi:hypothetical protein
VSVLYVYAVTRQPATADVEAVDGSRRFDSVSIDDIAAVFTPVAEEAFSQAVIDQRANDLEWLGAIGYRHQAVVAELMKQTAIVPLRAFTLFSSAEALRAYLHENRELLAKTLDRLDGKQEWTLRLEIDPERFNASIVTRVASLRALQTEIESAAAGKAFLLRKKLEEQKKSAARQAEHDLLAEVERELLGRLKCESIAETRERRGGAFPQINVLINRDEEPALQALQDELLARYEPEGVVVGVTGPWPPYSFAGTSDER